MRRDPPSVRAVVGLLLLFASGAMRPLAAQAPRPTVVVQVAGAELYIDLGTDAGLRVGDTLAVRRAAGGPPAGAVLVLRATARRSVLTYAGTAFPVTRGDTLFITPGAPPAAAVVASTVVAAEARPRAPPTTSRRVRAAGTLGIEMWGSHSETVGLGADPVRTTRDLGMPAVRFSTTVAGERSRFRLNLRAQQRTGPESVWDRQTRVRIYEARYDRTAGAMRLTLGRFYSDFDHQSAFWDGASLRFGDDRGVSAGVAAGFEPSRGNEEPAFDRPKAAAFVGVRRGTERTNLVADLAVTQTMPADRTQWRAGADLAMHLRLGRLSLSQDLEATPPTPMGRWGISRFVLRASFPAGARGSVYATAVSDRLTPLDTSFLAPFARRERLTGGYSAMLASGAFFDLNGSINDPQGETSGYAAGATVSIPRLVGAGTFSLHASGFDDGQGAGILASPALEYRLGTARLRGGYQFYRVEQRSFATQTHGLDLRLWQPFGARMSGVLQVTERIGSRLHGTTVFTSLEVRF